jgi:hypothetical protein
LITASRHWLLLPFIYTAAAAAAAAVYHIIVLRYSVIFFIYLFKLCRLLARPNWTLGLTAFIRPAPRLSPAIEARRAHSTYCRKRFSVWNVPSNRYALFVGRGKCSLFHHPCRFHTGKDGMFSINISGPISIFCIFIFIFFSLRFFDVGSQIEAHGRTAVVGRVRVGEPTPNWSSDRSLGGEFGTTSLRAVPPPVLHGQLAARRVA